MEQQYGICRVSVAPLRAEASDRSEITSQLLFGDHVEILKKEKGWWFVKNAYDEYEGWMDDKQLAALSLEQYIGSRGCDHLVPLRINNIVTDTQGTKYYLLPGSNLPFFENGFCWLGNEKYQVMFKPKVVSVDGSGDVVNSALFFLNAPYLWGGRNLFGIDCSGLIQIAFKLIGVTIQRDTSQQALQGRTVDSLLEVQPGDVAFFDNKEGKIIHVGLMLNAGEIIHASGKVRIDMIDNQGIYNTELDKYTHHLRAIKRFV